MTIKLDDKLYELQKSCNRYKAVDPLADWVLFAVVRHINTGRATKSFIDSFLAFPSDQFADLIKKCLNGDRSDDGIIKAVKRIIKA